MTGPAAPDPQPWDEIFRRDGRVFDSPAPVVHHVAERLREHGCRSVVDLGCGSGRHTVFLAQRGFRMLGIDNSPAALTLAREWLQLGGVDAGLIRADMRRPLPLPDACVDGLLSTQVIHHALLATVRGTARELSRILRPGGLLFVSVPLGTEPEEPFVEVEPATFVPTTGPEQGLPHHIFTPQTLYELFPAFKLLELDEIGGRILTLLAVRLPATQGPEDAGREP